MPDEARELLAPEWTRRRLIGTGIGVGLGAPLAGLIAGCGGNGDTTSAKAASATGSSAGARPRSGDEALAELLAGNERFAQGRSRHEGIDSVRRAELAQGQKPFAIVLGCSDSRVGPEIVFDQGLGELFVVRVAGNTAAAPVIVGSIEYAVEHLGSVLVMVLGHESCGAVAAAVATVSEGKHEAGSISKAVAPIVPVVREVRRGAPDATPEALAGRSVRANVENTVEELSHEPLLSHLLHSGELKMVGAEYHLQSGKVEVL